MTLNSGRLRREDVVDMSTFARYAQQRLGTPYPATKADWARAKVKIDPLFEQYDQFTFRTLADLVDWAKGKNKRFGSLAEVCWHVSDAFREGALPDMEPGHREEEEWQARMWAALENESDPEWRRRLLKARGEGREKTYTAWLKHYNQKLLEKAKECAST